MNLYVCELKLNALGQQITIGSSDVNLTAVRPHLYRCLTPSGTCAINICDANGNPFKQSEILTITNIGTGNYWHGYQRFLVNAQLKANTAYTIQLVGLGGYAFAEGGFLGWCNDFDLRKVPATFTPNTFQAAPMDLELWENQSFLRRTG